MLATPDTSHLSADDWRHVYEPAEDTFALLDALEQDADDIRRAKPRLVVEIGSGSGTVSAFVAAILRQGEHRASTSTAAFICTDINLHAAKATLATGERNGDENGTHNAGEQSQSANSRQTGTHLAPVLTPLLQALRPRCDGAIDLLLFNPPYVPTTEDEEQEAQRQGAIAGSWAGGTYGTALVEQLLPDLTKILAPGGRFYLVAIKQNQPEQLTRTIQGYGLQADVCLSRRAGREHLFILRAIKGV